MAPAQPPRCAWSRKRHCRWLPRSRATRARTRHSTASAPWRDQRRRRRDSQAACSRTRARWRRRTSWSSSRLRRQFRWARSPPSRCLPDPATAANAAVASPPPAEVRARVWTASSERAPTRLRRASESQCARVKAEPSGARGAAPGERRRSRGRDHRPEQRGDDASPTRRCRRETAGDTAGVARSSRCDRLECSRAGRAALALSCAIARSVPPVPDGPGSPRFGPSLRPFLRRPFSRNWSANGPGGQRKMLGICRDFV